MSSARKASTYMLTDTAMLVPRSASHVIPVQCVTSAILVPIDMPIIIAMPVLTNVRPAVVAPNVMAVKKDITYILMAILVMHVLQDVLLHVEQEERARTVLPDTIMTQLQISVRSVTQDARNVQTVLNVRNAKIRSTSYHKVLQLPVQTHKATAAKPHLETAEYLLVLTSVSLMDVRMDSGT